MQAPNYVYITGLQEKHWLLWAEVRLGYSMTGVGGNEGMDVRAEHPWTPKEGGKENHAGKPLSL